MFNDQTKPFVLKVGDIQTYGTGEAYIAQRPRCFQHVDGSVYLTVGTTTDSGTTIVPTARPSGTTFCF